jgi:hypothetical protein
MPRHEGAFAGQRKAALFFQHADHSHRNGHERGLGVFCQIEVAFFAYKHQTGEILPQRIIHALENLPRFCEVFGQLAAHTDAL